MPPRPPMAIIETQSPLTLPTASWPAEPVAFRALAAPSAVLVPLSVRPATHNILSIPPGTAVLPGQVLTDIVPETAHAALAPLAGIVGPTRLVSLSSGQTVRVIEITATATQSGEASAEPRLDLPTFTDRMAKLAADLTSDPAALPKWIDRLRNAGLFADRSTSPDLLGQLHQLLVRPIDTVICNILDLDPAVRLNASLAAQYPQEIAAGMHLFCILAKARHRLVVADDASPPLWIKPLRRLTRRLDIAMVSLHNDYPQPDPTLLLYRLLRRRLRPRRLPTEQGVLLVDAATACAIGRNILRAEKMLHVPLGIHDQIRRWSHLLWVPLGTPLRHILNQIGWTARNIVVRSGSLIRNMRITPEAVAGGTDLTIHLDSLRPATPPSPCIRCNWCAEGCPTRLQPAGVLEAAQRNDLELASRYGIEACIECGICSHVCPSRLPLLESIRTLRTA